ncbi:hypothetical protein AVEN_14822-1 [Araneus ventricosus]|uniref:Uncharacterized protein n=1 Tax=Araneus ventricosus TaxID=182803 RepID=A0A4Y2TG34_ARAVE|nr:hypothetical protein AVEN_155716-1 [Araneus ventricosus]GBN98393.1 hypothetical protein AVEN_14822-1 [Araneus ventricosus]
MPRVFKRVLGARKYIDHSPESLEVCFNVSSPDECTLKDKEYFCGPPICHKRKQPHVRKPGRPLVFSQEDEEAVSASTVQLSDFGFPAYGYRTTILGYAKSKLLMVGTKEH